MADTPEKYRVEVHRFLAGKISKDELIKQGLPVCVKRNGKKQYGADRGESPDERASADGGATGRQPH